MLCQVLSLFYTEKMESQDDSELRRILSHNIRSSRKALRFTQEQLAEYADISLSYLTDIERCKTWVSDRTLLHIAKALNKDVYQLFISPDVLISEGNRTSSVPIEFFVNLIAGQKTALSKHIESAMDELLAKITKNR
jgi:transcriptional regulator with XRE-family HTH domain